MAIIVLSEVIMTPAGRPFSSNPKSIKYSIRLDADTENRLIAYCEKHEIKKGEAIRRAIELLLNNDSEVR